MAKVQISLENEILEKIDLYVKANGLNRSSFLAMAAMDYIKAKELAPVISGSFASMANIMNAQIRGEISTDEAKAQLDLVNASLKSLGNQA